MNKGYIALWILGAILLVLNVLAVVSLLKKGDERRQLIVWKSSTYTFSIAIGILILDCIANLVTPLLNLPTTAFDNGSSPFTMLTVLSIIYFISLKLNKKKYGD